MSFPHLIALLTLLALFLPGAAAPPAWWATGNPPIITGGETNHRGPANIGQAKWMVAEALRALDTAAPAIALQIRADLTGTAPSFTDRLLDLTVPNPKPPAWIEAQKAPLLLGQLKAISAPFYTRLHAAHPTWLTAERTTNATHLPDSIFPWTTTPADDQNQAIATLGQLKAVFSLRFETLLPTDLDSDGLPDMWELANQLNPFDPLDAVTNLDGDYYNNLQEHTLGTDPSTYLNLADADGDWMPDSYEVTHGLDPQVFGGYEDADGDRIPEYFEFFRGSSPSDPLSKPKTTFFVDPAKGGLSTTDNIFSTITEAVSTADQPMEGYLNTLRSEYSIIEIKGGKYPENVVWAKARILLLGEQGSKNGPVKIMPINRRSPYGFLTTNSSSIIDSLAFEHCKIKLHSQGRLDISYDHRIFLSNNHRLVNCSIMHDSEIELVSGDLDLFHCTLFINQFSQNKQLVTASGSYSKLNMINSVAWIYRYPGYGFGDGLFDYSISLDRKSGIYGANHVGDTSFDPQLTPSGWLKKASPLINQVYIPGCKLPPLDIHGEPRPTGSAPESGAGEYKDSNGINDGDGVPDWAEGPDDLDGLTALAEYEIHGTDPCLADTDGDGLNDGTEVAAGYDPLNHLEDQDWDGMPTAWEVFNGFDPKNPNDGALDFDSDGFTNSEEYEFERHPKISDDKDLDLIPDGWEVIHHLNPLNGGSSSTDPDPDGADGDPDGDGLVNYLEFGHRSNPRLADTDGDGVGDLAETVGLEIPISSPYADADGDGWTDLQEMAAGTDSNNKDNDLDGMPDPWEVSYSLNPRVDDATLNPDSDSYSNLIEYQLGTNPRVADPPDTDHDRMADLWETRHNLNPQTNDSDQDPDHDGFTNLEEYRNGTNPRVADLSGDYDADRMPDRWETRHGLNPDNYYDGNLNPDGDLRADGTPFTNLMEFRADTDPTRSDTDADGMPDGWEVSYSLNPRKNDSALNPDSDTHSNLVEYENRTNPLIPDPPDTDLDGMLDPWEITYQLDPHTNDSDHDPDHDGFTNLEERQNGTNPRIADYTEDYDYDGIPDIWERRYGLFVGFHPNSDVNPDGDICADGTPFTNLMEFMADTNPNRFDTDSDGMPDPWEVSYSLNPRKDDATLNPDSDSYTNLEEYNLGTNPQIADPPDVDQDRIPDAWEVSNNLDPQTNNSDHDPDHDGFTNLEEYRNGTNPQVTDAPVDSDSDGMPDIWEIRHGLKFYFDDSMLNPDGDLRADGTPFTNLMEFRSDTNPHSRDTDSDRLPDGWEVSYNFNPRSNRGEDGSDGDPDGDNLKNTSEFLKRTNPRLADTDGDGINDLLDTIESVDTSTTGSLDTDGDGLTDAQEYNLGSSIYLTDTNDDGIDDATAYASGKDPAKVDADGDGLEDPPLYSVEFESVDQSRSLPLGRNYKVLTGTSDTKRYLTTTYSDEYSISGSYSYPNLVKGIRTDTRSYKTSKVHEGYILRWGDPPSTIEGFSESEWRSANYKPSNENEDYEDGISQVSQAPPIETETERSSTTTTTTPWKLYSVRNRTLIRSGVEISKVTRRTVLSDQVTIQTLWVNYFKPHPWAGLSVGNPYSMGPHQSLGQIRPSVGDSLAADHVRRSHRDDNFDVWGSVTDVSAPILYVDDCYEGSNKSLRWRWIRFNPNKPFDYEYAAPTASYQKSFYLSISQENTTYLRSRPRKQIIEKIPRGIVQIDCKGSDGQGWHTVDPTVLGKFKIADPANLKEADFDKCVSSDVMYHKVLMGVAVDANRDGEITFDHKDKTTNEKPYRFWINNDRDVGKTVDKKDWEQDDYGDVENGTSEDIYEPGLKWQRDLEDISRVWIDMKSLKSVINTHDANITLNVRIERTEGSPAITLFQPVEADGGRKYLIDEGTGHSQLQTIYGEELCTAGNTPEGDPIPRRGWEIGKTDTAIHFLFEAKRMGKGKLIFEFRKSGKLLLKLPPVFLDLKNAKEMYETWTVGDVDYFGVDNTKWPENVARQTSGQNIQAPKTDEEKDYVMFVHGWNMAPWEKEAYASTMFKRMWHQGYQGRFGAFRWPTFHSFEGSFLDLTTDLDHFNGSEQRAWESASRLKALIENRATVFGQNKIRLYAHSMGNIVCGEALRQFGSSGLPANSSSPAPVHSYIAAQAAISSHVYNRTIAPRKIADRAAMPNIYGYYWQPGASDWPLQWEADQRPSYMDEQYLPRNVTYINHYNVDDYALNDTRWPLNQNLKPLSPYAYFHNPNNAKPTDRFVHQRNAFTLDVLTCPTNRYEIFSYAADSEADALGKIRSIGGKFSESLDVVPLLVYDDKPKAHKYHSGQFRSTIQKRWEYWKLTLKNMKTATPTQ